MRRTRYRYLTDDGTPTGSAEATLNFASPTKFWVGPPSPGERILINWMQVHIQAAGMFGPDAYGSMVALTNGILVEVHEADGSVVLDLLEGLPIKTNADWARRCNETEERNWSPPDDRFLSVRWPFASAGAPVILTAGQQFVVVLNDDFSTLASHTFLFEGIQQVVQSDAVP